MDTVADSIPMNREVPLAFLSSTSRMRPSPAATCGLARPALNLPLLALLFILCPTAPPPAHAGGGPENVLLVVNSNSESSKAIANHYIALRKIPAKNVVYIDWKGGLRATKGETFLNRILMPVIHWIEDHKLNAQIDYVVYSSDFPTRVELQKFFVGEKQPSRLDSAGSLTGLTYLTPFVLNHDSAATASNVNWYVPGPRDENLNSCQQLANVPTRGFRAVYLWDHAGNRSSDPKAGQRYLLSTMLGVTYGRGNTVDEILSYLRRAAAADGKRPKGTIYFMKNGDRRSAPRDRCFDGMAAEINRLGVRAEVKQGTIPWDPLESTCRHASLSIL